MPPRKNLIGEQFGRLKVIKFSHINKRGNAIWECLCSCNNKVYLSSWHLSSENTKSCGCLSKDIHRKIINDNKPWKLTKKYWTPIFVNEKDVKIPLEGEEFSLIDKEDIDKVKSIYWALNSKGYVSGKLNGKRVLIHRLITGFKEGVVHHKNRNKKDNRKQNLEILEKRIHDAHPRGITKNNTSGVVGVHKRRDTEKYPVRKYINGIRVYIGQANSMEEASILMNSFNSKVRNKESANAMHEQKNK